MTAQQTDAITDPQSIIAALQRRLDAALSEKAALAEELAAQTAELAARNTELATRNSDVGERIEHQAATIDVLKAMSASPGDAQPVFDLIARQAAKLCNVPTAAVATFDGTNHSLNRRRSPSPAPPTSGPCVSVPVTFRNRSNTRSPPATC